MAARHIDPARLLVLCVGDVDAMKDGDGQNPQTLAALGDMTVHAARAPADLGTPAAVVRQILGAMGEGDMETVKSHGTEAMRKRLEETPDMAQRLSMFKRMLETATVSAPEITEDGDKAEALVTIEASFGEQAMMLAMRMELVRESGTWKCESFAVGPRDS